MPHKNREKFFGVGCFLLMAEGYSCSLGVLYGVLEISKLQMLVKKYKISFTVKILQFLAIKILADSQLE